MEFVLALPFLLGLTAAIFSLGFAALAKSELAAKVRLDVWQKRSQLAAATPTRPLAAFAPSQAMAGQIDGEARRTVRLYRWLGNATAESRATVLTGSWDYEEVPQFNGSRPHFGVLTLMARGGLSQLTGIGELARFSSLLRISQQIPAIRRVTGEVQLAIAESWEAAKSRWQRAAAAAHSLES